MSQQPSIRPFRWAERLLKGMTAPHLQEEILGDLDELFHQRGRRDGYRKAQLLYLLDILLLLHPRLWRRERKPSRLHYHAFPFQPEHRSTFFLNPAMLRNYLKITFRNLIKDRVYSFINIGGLAVGMAVTLLLVLFIAHEYSYDRFHQKSGQIYKMVGQVKMGDQELKMMSFDYDQIEALRRQVPAVADVARHGTYFGAEMWVESNRQHRFKEQRFVFADPGFFRLFSFQVLQGNPQTALGDQFKVFLTQQAAQKYFGTQNPVGQTIRLLDKYTFEVVGLLANPPSNNSIPFEFVASFRSLDAIQRTENAAFYAQVPVKGTMAATFETHLLLQDPAQRPAIEKLMAARFQMPQWKVNYSLMPLPALHFEVFPKIGRSVEIFSLVAGLILVLALINYVNLTTARATIRAKEVGIRKATGAHRSALAGQFLLESTVMSTLAFGLGFALFFWLRSTFTKLLDWQSSDSFLVSPYFVGAAVALYALSVLLSSIYPAIRLSGFSPILALKGRFNQATGGVGFRQVLSVSQFVVTVGLIIGSMGIYRQWTFMQQYSGSLQRERVVLVSLEKQAKNHAAAFRQQIGRLAGVEQVGGTAFGIVGGHQSFALKHRRTAQDQHIFNINVDRDFFNTLRIEWKVRPNWQQLGNQNVLILNESALRALNITPAQVGDSLMTGGSKTPSLYLAGVIKDFPISSLSNKIDPLSIMVGSDAGNYSSFYVRLAENASIPPVLQAIQGIYNQYKVEEPFTYQFLDDAYADLYRPERQLTQLFAAATLIAVFIACLGIFGLTTFMADQRTKEIGIRKVLGASATSIVRLLSKDFLKLVLTAILIATPLAWYAMDHWLQGFAYKTSLEWWMFVLAGGAALLIAALTVSYQSIKAALTNPVKSLRSE